MILDALLVHRVREGDADAVARRVLVAVRGRRGLHVGDADGLERPRLIEGDSRVRVARLRADVLCRGERRAERERHRGVEDHRDVVRPLERARDGPAARGRQREALLGARAIDGLVEDDADVGLRLDECAAIRRRERRYRRRERAEAEAVVIVERGAEVVEQARLDARAVGRGRRPARLRAEGVQRGVQPVAIALDGRRELDHALRTAPIDDCERRDGAVELHHDRAVEGDLLRALEREHRRDLELAGSRELVVQADGLRAGGHLRRLKVERDVVRRALREARPLRAKRQDVAFEALVAGWLVAERQRLHRCVTVDIAFEPDAHGGHELDFVGSWTDHFDT